MCSGNLGNTLNHIVDPGGLFTKDTQEAQTATAPTAPPQASKAASTTAQRNANATAENSQGATPSTLLTGATGVDPNALQLGKNTLLGS